MQRNVRILLDPATYTNKNGNLIGVKQTAVMFKLAQDLDARMAAMKIIQRHAVAFVCDMAVRSMPVGVPGSNVATVLDTLGRDSTWQRRTTSACTRCETSFIPPLQSSAPVSRQVTWSFPV